MELTGIYSDKEIIHKLLKDGIIEFYGFKNTRKPGPKPSGYKIKWKGVIVND